MYYRIDSGWNWSSWNWSGGNCARVGIVSIPALWYPFRWSVCTIVPFMHVLSIRHSKVVKVLVETNNSATRDGLKLLSANKWKIFPKKNNSENYICTLPNYFIYWLRQKLANSFLKLKVLTLVFYNLKDECLTENF